MLALSGELDPATAPDLEAAIARCAADGDVATVTLDLAGVTFLDSSGLRVLVAARESLRAAGTELALRGPNANIRRVLEITGLGEVIAID